MIKSAYGLNQITTVESPYGVHMHSCASIRTAITAIPDDERDDWYLPNSERSWAYWRGGNINYQFADDLGDTYPAFYCGECAERRILTGTEPRPYLTASMYSSETTDYCDDCNQEVSN